MSILKRSAFSILSNFIKSIITFLISILLARGLSVSDYGDYSFLIVTSIAIKSFFDLGSEQAFFTFISKKTQPKSFYFYYFLWLTFQFSVIMAFITLLAPNSLIEKIWLGQEKRIILLAFVSTFIQTHIWKMISEIGESQRLTFKVQYLNLSLSIFNLISLFLLFSFSLLRLEIIFIILISNFIIFIFLSYIFLNIEYSEEKINFLSTFEKFKAYCLPFIPYTFIGFASDFLNRWMLQNFSGPVEQGYFSIAHLFTGTTLIATTSILKILWKELAESNERKNNEKFKLILIRAGRIIFFVSSVISCFLLPWIDEITIFLYGEQYRGGILVMGIMLLFPIHQAFGMVTVTGYLSIGLTKLYVLTRSFGIFLGVIVAFFALAPQNFYIPGYELGAFGLAIGMVGAQFISSNFDFWILTRKLKIKYHIIYQFSCILTLLFLSYGINYLITIIIDLNLHFIFNMFLSGVLYISLVWLLIIRHQYFFGLNKEIVASLKDEIKKIAKQLFKI